MYGKNYLKGAQMEDGNYPDKVVKEAMKECIDQ